MEAITNSAEGLDRRMFLKRAGTVGLGLTMAGGLLAACGGASSTSGEGTLAIGSTDWLPTDFYIQKSLGADLLGWSQMAWALFMGSGSGYEYRYGLASKYAVSPDGLTHTVTLRDGIAFHDGSPIDADAVAANLRGTFFVNDPLHRGKSAYIQVIITLGEPPVVKAVDVLDKRTIAIRLKEYRSDIRTALAFIPILSPKTLRMKSYGTDVKALEAGGSGPFRLTQFEPGAYAEFTKYDDFFEPVLPKRVLLRGYEDPGTLALALRAGDVDIASGLAKADYESATKSGFRAVTSQPAVNVDLIFSHPKDPAFADPRVRKAFALAMNRKAYVERFYNPGTAIESTQPIIPPGLPGFVPGLRPLPYDPEAARKLLAETGFKAPRLTIVAPTAEAPTTSTKELLEAIAADVNQVGFQVSVQVIALTGEAAVIEEGKAEAFVEGPGGQPEPFILFDLYFSSIYAPGQLSKYPIINRNLAAARVEHDATKRDELLQDVIKVTTEELLLIPIAVVDYSVLASPKVQDYHLSCTQLDSWNGVRVG